MTTTYPRVAAGTIISVSKDETLLLSSSGDVLTCRCRDSALRSAFIHPQQETTWNHFDWGSELTALCCKGDFDDDLSTRLQETATTGLCGQLTTATIRPNSSMQSPYQNNHHRPGLLGGALTEKVAPLTPPSNKKLNNNNNLETPPRSKGSEERRMQNTLRAFRATTLDEQPQQQTSENHGTMEWTPTKTKTAATIIDTLDDGSIVPIQSFDYSHFADGGNDMLPESAERKKRTTSGGLKQNATRPHPNSHHHYDYDMDDFNPLARTHTKSSQQYNNQSNSSDDIMNNNNNNNNSYYRPLPCDSLVHGVPTFLSSFRNIKITQISTHPLGSHALLVSSAGILYAYGQNQYGQLGIGVKTNPKTANKGYILAPTIITPLLENGGKTIHVAAGVDHSLVLVQTEEQRLLRTISATTTNVQQQQDQEQQQPQHAATETVLYHQLYGFGRNDSMKIGLVSPKKAPADETNCVTLPKRVALRCKIVHSKQQSQQKQQQQQPQGIFALEASEHHSAALVRRASGDVELYMWGRASYGALGLVNQNQSNTSVQSSSNTSTCKEPESSRTTRVIPIPTVVPTLSMIATTTTTSSKTKSATTNKKAIPASLLQANEYPKTISLGRNCSFVVTSLGRCFSFGTSLEGMLGLGSTLVETDTPRLIALERIQSVSAGAAHVLALTEEGHVYAWGSRLPCGLSSGAVEMAPRRPKPQEKKKVHQEGTDGDEDSNNDEDDDEDDMSKYAVLDIEWSPKRLEISSALTGSEEEKKEDVQTRVALVGAGFDSSVFVTESGHVLSCGKQSGRLGMGEVNQNIQAPQPMFGGLRLWQTQQLSKASTILLPTSPPNQKVLKRHYSTSAF
jgi:alpha-tubulin suppressor-like RCC1 family protein